MVRFGLAASLLAALFAPGGAWAQEVVRHRVIDSDLPISQAIEVPDGRSIVFLSSLGPAVQGAPTSAPLGDTKAQTTAVLKRLEEVLSRLALTHSDVVKVQVFLVGDPRKGNRMDLAGFNEAYKQFYGTPAQPALPSRSVVQVAGLSNPGWLVQIEATAVRPHPR